MSEYFVIGKIVNTQGIKGEIRVLPSTEDINRFKLLKEVYVQKKGTMEIFEIENIRFHKQFVLLKFKGIDTMTDGEKLKNTEIKIPKEMAIPCEEDEYYIGDLYGINVIEESGEDLGTLEDIIFTGANDVYVVRKDDSEILIPAIKKCILNVDINEKIMKVKLLEGLR